MTSSKSCTYLATELSLKQMWEWRVTEHNVNVCAIKTNDLTNKNGKGMEETGKPESKFADCLSTIID